MQESRCFIPAIISSTMVNGFELLCIRVHLKLPDLSVHAYNVQACMLHVHMYCERTLQDDILSFSMHTDVTFQVRQCSLQ